MSTSTWNLRLKWPTPFEKPRLPPISAYNVSTVKASDKCSIIANRKSTTCFPTSYRWSAYVTPNSPKGGSKSEFVVFMNKIQVQSNKVCCKVSLCENFQRQSCSRTIPLSNGSYKLAVNVTLEPNIYPKVTHPFYKSRFRRISASAVRASEK